MKVLQMFAEPFSSGGQEAFIMNMYENIDKNKVQFDFFTPYYCDNVKMKERIESMGGRIFAQNGSFDSKNRKKIFIKEAKEFLKLHKYDIIHIHSGSIFALAFGSKIAKKSGAKRVIVHSHVTGINTIKYRIIKKISERIFLKNATDYLACSHMAAEWKFPEEIIEKKEYTVLHNGIELEKYKFSEEARKEYREKFGLQGNFVICNIGRLVEQKNQEFLIDIFNEICKKNANSKLLLIGEGEKEDILKAKVKDLKLEDKTIFLKKRNDIEKILQAADVFVFPSIMEGLGIAAIEAQAAGLPTICSENIPEDANLTSLFHTVRLEDGSVAWRDEILKYINYQRNQESIKELKEKGYNAIDCAKNLELIYMRKEA